jgi:hypothetical protein
VRRPATMPGNLTGGLHDGSITRLLMDRQPSDDE